MRKLVLALLFGLSMAAWAETPQRLFDQTWDLVESQFYDPGLRGLDSRSVRAEAARALQGISDKEQAVAIINGFLARLRTSHTYLYCDRDPRYYELLDIFSHLPEVKERLGGQPPRYTGILAVVEDGTVVDVVPGGPAAEANLIPGDRILGVAGSLEGPLQAYHPIGSFEGKAGQELYLQVQSGLVLARRKVVPRLVQPRQAFLDSITASATLEEVEGRKLGYVRVYSYASSDYQDRLLELLAGPLAEAEGLVWDLRGGWGGAQLAYLEPFQPLPTLEMTFRGQPSQSFRPHWNRPVVMVVDGRSRSGKELLAYAFQKQNLGLLVGSRTAGAVSAGGIYLLPDGCALYLARASVKVDGQVLEGVGVSPDEPLMEPRLPSADPTVKEQALRRLRRLLDEPARK